MTKQADDAAESQRALEERAEAAGLLLVASDSLRIVRRGAGRGFTYRDAGGRRITDRETLARIRSLAIPPAYREVRIAEDPRAHLQAVGRDEAGRTQHRYHPDWNAVREDGKLERLASLIGALPRIRAAVRRDLAAPGFDRAKATACAIALIDESHIRVGCEVYARTSGSRGAATLLKRQVSIKGDRIELHFRGKGGRDITCSVEEPHLARSLGRVARLPGRRLLQYRDEAGKSQRISAADINAYLRRVAGVPVSAKDLRTLAASATAAKHFLDLEPAASRSGRQRQAAEVMRAVAERLSNTPAVVRKSYVPALVVQSFASGALKRTHQKTRGERHRRRIENTLASLVSTSA